MITATVMRPTDVHIELEYIQVAIKSKHAEGLEIGGQLKLFGHTFEILDIHRERRPDGDDLIHLKEVR
jgi:hypothetical protein